MDFDLSEEQRMLTESVGRWLAASYRFQDFRRSAGDAVASKSNWMRMADLGLLGVNVGENNGGLGGGAVETMLVMRSFGQFLVVEPFVETAVVAVALLDSAPWVSRRDEVLSRISDGTCRIAVAALERDGRYDLAHVETTANATAQGFVLNGKKAVVLHGDSADLLAVSARTARGVQEGISVFLVDAHAPGVNIRGFPTIDGKRAAEIEFDDVKLPAGALLGLLNGGLLPLEWAIDRALAALCAEAVGAMEKLLEMTAAHLRNRQQFGQSLGRFQSLQHRIAEMAVAIEQARSMMLLAAAKVDDPDRVMRHRTIAAAKVMIGRSGRFVGQQAVQLHGGMGMTDELAVGYYFKRLTAIDMTWGNVEHHVETYGDLMCES
jgi:alkylation response protein AidB-like acyl-CoA dehydrogenase